MLPACEAVIGWAHRLARSTAVAWPSKKAAARATTRCGHPGRRADPSQQTRNGPTAAGQRAVGDGQWGGKRGRPDNK